MKLVYWHRLPAAAGDKDLQYAEWLADAAAMGVEGLSGYVRDGFTKWNAAWLEVCARELVKRDPVHQPLLDEMIVAAARERLELSEGED